MPRPTETHIQVAYNGVLDRYTWDLEHRCWNHERLMEEGTVAAEDGMNNKDVLSEITPRIFRVMSILER